MSVHGTGIDEMNDINFKELFALGVRLSGVWLIVRGMAYFESFVDVKLYPYSDQLRDRAAGSLIYATFDFALAAFFLFWTHLIVAWTYGDDSRAPAEPKAGEETEIDSSPPA